MSFAEKFGKEKEQFNADRGDWFKFVEGPNKLRILSEPASFQEDFKLGICYTDCSFKGSMKYLAWVYDYKDSKLKKMKIPYSIMESIVSQMTSEDYSFTDFPMPYDITITASNAGTKEVKYAILPARLSTPMAEDVMEEFAKKKSPVEMIDEMKERNKKKHQEDGTFDRLHEDKASEGARVRKAFADNGEDEEDIEYPEDDLNPEDIPF